jgi:hypothetical protein
MAALGIIADRMDAGRMIAGSDRFGGLAPSCAINALIALALL